MKNIKGIKTGLVILTVLILFFLGYQYYRYMDLQNYLEDYKSSFVEDDIILDITDSHDEYGEVWPRNKKEMAEILEDIHNEREGKTQFIEKYGYNIKIDTVDVEDDTLKRSYVEYQLYSYGPDRSDGKLKNLPFNTGDGEELTNNVANIVFREVPFWKYLFMDKNFDIILVYAISEYDCALKRYHQIEVRTPEKKAVKMTSARILRPGRKSIGQADATYDRDEEDNIHTKELNQTLQAIQIALAQQYPDTPTEGLIFNYNGKRVRCICSFNVPDAPVTTIEKILTEKLNATATYIGMTAFYMEVPVLQ